MPYQPEPIEADQLDDWMNNEWRMYATRSSRSTLTNEGNLVFSVRVGAQLFRVVRHTSFRDTEVLYEGPSKERAISIFNEHHISTPDTWMFVTRN